MFSALSEGKTIAKTHVAVHAIHSVLIILEHKVAATPGRDNMDMYKSVENLMKTLFAFN